MSPNESLLILFFTTGLTIGFGHCIGMCGPIVVGISSSVQSAGMSRTFVPHVFYNLGRVVTYTAMGAVMGLTGSFTRVAAHLDTAQKVVMVLAGLVIIAMGLQTGGWLKLLPVSCFGPQLPRLFSRILGRNRGVWGYLPLGLVLGFLPCGPVYTALIAAARSGMETGGAATGAGRGAAIMLAFGAGTLPAMLIVGKLSYLAWLRSRPVVVTVGAALLVAAGIYFTIRGILY